ncbi:MAG: methyltransferase [Flavobacteriia bacterium]|nr:methyltransferase [Flavobacteriia bacterium]OIP45711.1 MAG: tRNA (adenine-N(6)-)-methyltransferase [Flavobacteriaceae bacterium CG2_30_31_66]PIV97146.1 MAG: tRNA (adenine-N(6)-)-methyltransferase [Flavobacteriaceae bacterium CG17_big_fil_post_rev_8_21_14_2_50_31_13]PIX13631.1 MAG: tRNA (adenine-N(6)-)-methyltransferase [Flavobacteriaceae bacterium CG_4_8_14_3_um_filter_31_8]PIY14865.1 MAG: tRNA (adenine-N(6)-)-methyltransferase [Flavobacteriaceae bacterium CG_4_10_14_3_um_filter_31_253]PIZ0
MSSFFKFKQFLIQQDKSAMKIGTDAVLLGAWCSISHFPVKILDIGSGTGIISLMLAQRSDAETIDAIEIDKNAFEQSVENFEKSFWADRLYCYHCSFQEFVDEISLEEETYDLIVSNPPFYTDDSVTDNESRNKARFTSSLSFEDLLLGVSRILSQNGFFSVIIPFKEEENFVNIANENQLFLTEVCRVQGNLTSELKRSLLTFSFEKSTIKASHLIIETERHKYTQEYINLTKDFYLKM